MVTHYMTWLLASMSSMLLVGWLLDTTFVMEEVDMVHNEHQM